MADNLLKEGGEGGGEVRRRRGMVVEVGGGLGRVGEGLGGRGEGDDHQSS